MAREKILLGWSGGNDSALALRAILRGGQHEIAALLTTCTIPSTKNKSIQFTNSMNKTRSSVLAGMILAAAASRLIPHPPNFTPIAAMALFGGACFSDKRAAFLVPLAGLLASDLVIGFHKLMPMVYGCFVLIVCLGFWLRRHRSVWRVAGVCAASAVLFFVLTNFAVWAFGALYPKTAAGLLECYVAAIPFFRNMLLGDLFYAGVLFGGFALAEHRCAILRENFAVSPQVDLPQS